MSLGSSRKFNGGQSGERKRGETEGERKREKKEEPGHHVFLGGDGGGDSVHPSYLRSFEMYSHLPTVHTVRRGYTCSCSYYSSSERLATVTVAPLCSGAPFSSPHDSG